MLGNVLIAQGGGPTAVINQSLVGIIMSLKKYNKIQFVYGALYGINGIINENLIDLKKESIENLEKVANNTGAALFTTRDKPNKKYVEKILKVFRKYNIKYFFYIGGNDSAETVNIINKYAEKKRNTLKTFHIPKTIDNDLELNYYTPGYPSAAKFVAEAFIGIDFEIKSLPGVYIGVLMGRNSGFLTASSVLGKKIKTDGPHLVYVPEVPFSLKKFLRDVKKVYDNLGRCVIAISEGIVDENFIPIVMKLKEKNFYDQHGNISLSGNELGNELAKNVKKKLNISRVRADTFGYLQRSFLNSIALIDKLGARKIGEKAVFYALNTNYKNGSIVIKMQNNKFIYEITCLENIAKKTRVMPLEYISIDNNYITKKFNEYMKPLLGKDFKKKSELKYFKIKK